MNKQESLILSDEAMLPVIYEMGESLRKQGKEVTQLDRFQAIAKAQAKHMLEQLEKEGLLIHTHVPRFDFEQDGSMSNFRMEHDPDCRACAALREVEK